MKKVIDGKVYNTEVAEGLRNGKLPSGKGYWITLDILAKKAGRKNSKAYAARANEVEKILVS